VYVLCCRNGKVSCRFPPSWRRRAAMAELVADGTQKRIFRQYGLA
jgi:hypothetical protein